MVLAKISAPLCAYVTLLKDRNTLDLELMSETAQVKSRSTSLKMSEVFEKSVRNRIPRQENLDRGLILLRFPASESNSHSPQSSVLCQPGGRRISEISDDSEQLTVNDASFLLLGQSSHYKFEAHAGMQLSAVAAASKNVAEWAANGFGLSGFLSKIKVPAQSTPTQVQISSRMQSHFSWVEANGLLPGASVELRAVTHLAVSSNGQLFYSTHRLIGLQANYEQILSHKDLTTDSPAASFALTLNIAAQTEGNIEALEFIELSAIEQNGHGYVSGLFSWEPLRTSLRDGSHPGFPYKGGDLRVNSHRVAQ